ASAASTRTQPFRIVVSPCSVDDGDLRGFTQHLSYRYRGKPYQQRIYNFLGEQREAVTAIDLQIVLGSDTLSLIRARRPNIWFYESDE
ncbi:hypothetical protein AAVH_42230, partial [Aphelenchoides avenae]